MNKLINLFLVILFCSLPLVSQATEVFTLDSDTDFVTNFVPDRSFVKVGGANIRWGLPGGADWEYAIVDGNDIPIAPPGSKHLEWGTDLPYDHDVSFTYLSDGNLTLDLDDPGTGTDPDFALTGDLSDEVAVLQGINTLLIRARINTGETADLSDIKLKIGADPVINLGDLVGDLDAAYIGVIDSDLANGFLLYSDDAYLGDSGNRSRPMYGIKLGQSSNLVPEPGTYLTLGCFLLVLVARRRQAFILL